MSQLRVDELFEQALELNEVEQMEFLEGLPQDEADELRQLLNIDAAPDGFLDEPLLGDSYRADASNVESHLSRGSTLIPGRRDGAADPVPQAIGRYPVQSLLAAGGQGLVYLALHPLHGDRVVLKKSRFAADAEVHDGLKAEALTLTQLNHPFLVKVRDLEFDDDYPFLVLDYVPGEALDAKLKSEVLPPRRVVLLMWRLARAMRQPHDRGIVHHDLKPANIMINEKGRPVVIDFGLARLRSAWISPENRRVAGGTIAYMAPEQARVFQASLYGQTQAHDTDRRADLFSLGAIMFHCLVGQPLYKFDEVAEGLKLAAVADFDASLLKSAGVSKGIRRVCLKALEPNPDDRYQSVRGFGGMGWALLWILLKPWLFAALFVVAAAVGYHAWAGDHETDAVDQSTDTAAADRATTPDSSSTEGRDADDAATDSTDNSSTASSTSDTGNNAPTSGAPMRLEVVLKHYRNEGETSHEFELFEEGNPVEDDDLTLTVTFPEPVYCFLIALNPNGVVQRCYPAEPDVAQVSPVSHFKYPPLERQGFPFTDGAGQQAFVLITSSEELPPLSKWLDSVELPAWPEGTAGGETGRWVWKDGKLAPFRQTRGDPRDLKGANAFDRICRHIDAIDGLTVTAYSFPVEKPAIEQQP